MRKNENCPYCMENDVLESFATFICELRCSKVYMFNEQTFKGRCVVAYKDHCEEIYMLPEEDKLNFIKDVSDVAQAIQETYGCQKLNYGAYGDKMPHLHFHLVPKYEGQEDWGSTFQMNPGKVYLSDEDKETLISTLRNKMRKEGV